MEGREMCTFPKDVKVAGSEDPPSILAAFLNEARGELIPQVPEYQPN